MGDGHGHGKTLFDKNPLKEAGENILRQQMIDSMAPSNKGPSFAQRAFNAVSNAFSPSDAGAGAPAAQQGNRLPAGQEQMVEMTGKDGTKYQVPLSTVAKLMGISQ